MKETELGWKDALKLTAMVKALGCFYPIAYSVELSSKLKPDPEQPASVMCALKVNKGEEFDLCSAVDGSYCPLKIPIETLQDLRNSLKS